MVNTKAATKRQLAESKDNDQNNERKNAGRRKKTINGVNKYKSFMHILPRPSGLHHVDIMEKIEF